MPLFQVQAVLHTADQVAANFVTNTWWISVRNDEVGSPTQAELVDGINGHLETFYNDLRLYMSSLLSLTGHELKWYAMEDPTPRAPKYVGTFAFSSFGVYDNLPSEVALVSSYQAEKVSGTNQARRRNRIFIGPLNVNALDDNTGRPNPLFIATIVSEASAFALTSDGANGWSWRVYSGLSGQDHPIANGWVDNAFDTQRRRGAATSSRSVWVQQSE